MFQNGWFFIFFGGFLILIGGILGTYGWTQRSVFLQKKKIEASVVRECEANSRMINELIRIIRDSKEGSWNFSYRPYKTSIDPVTHDRVHASLLIFPELVTLVDRVNDWINKNMNE